MRKSIILLILAMPYISVTAQEYTDTTPQGHLWEAVFNELSTTDESESGMWEDMYDILCELEQNSININTATRDDLERIPFLNDQQIEDICAYTYRYKGMKSIGELAMIQSLDYLHRKLLTNFIYIGENNTKKDFPKIKKIVKDGNNTLLITAKVPFYDRKGDDKGYLGYKYKHSFRYTFNYSDYVKLGITGSQDAGEPFFANRNGMGYDHYTFYLSIRKLGIIKNLTVGRYKIRRGYGLVINNDVGLGKIYMLSSLGRSNNTINGYSSRSSANYMQGAATTIGITKGLDITAFISYRKIDATLNSEGTSITTILTSGYHRTEKEMEKKNNSSRIDAGGGLDYKRNGFNFGITALYTSFDKPLEPNTSQKYKKYYAAGKNFWNAGIHYGYINSRLSIGGETATGDSHAIATVNKVSLKASRSLSLIALQRFYSYKYYSSLANSFCSGGYIQNESGVYLGAEWKPLYNLSISAYTDYAHYPWMKYQISKASNSWENYISATYNIKKLTLYTRYSIRMKEKDNSDKTALIDNNTQKARLSLLYNGGKLSLNTQLNFTNAKTEESSNGWMISETMSYKPNKKLQATANIAYFHTDDYYSRIYTSERNTLYSVYFPSFYGEGIHYSLFIRTDISPTLMLIGKLSTTDYFDRDRIGTGLQQIDHSSMTDVEVQVRMKF